YVLRNRLFDMARDRGAPIPHAEQIIFFALIPLQLSAYVLGAIVVCAAIADDLRLGAFKFYFARPLRARDYITGKLLGILLVIAVPSFAGPPLLALVRLCFAEDVAQVPSLLPFVPRAMLLGIVGTAAFALPPAAMGALLGRRQPAQALYIVVFVLVSN